MTVILVVLSLFAIILSYRASERARKLERKVEQITDAILTLQTEGSQIRNETVDPVSEPASPLQDQNTIDTSSAHEASSHETGSVSQNDKKDNSADRTGVVLGRIKDNILENWLIWAGAIVMALGGAFLFRHGLEHGWLPPIARVIIGLIVGAALLAFALRMNKGLSFVPLPDTLSGHPHVPGAIGAVGVTTLFAALYTSHAFYQFIDAPLAFAALAVAAAIGLASAWLLGPILAWIGLFGAFATPLLVSSDDPSPWVLVIYIPLVTMATMMVGMSRGVRGFRIAASFANALWLSLLIGEFQKTSEIADIVTAFSLLTFSLIVLAHRVCWPAEDERRTVFRPAQHPEMFLLVFLVFAMTLHLLRVGELTSGLALYTIAGAVLYLATWWRERFTIPALSMVVSVLLVLLAWSPDMTFSIDYLIDGPTPNAQPADYILFSCGIALFFFLYNLAPRKWEFPEIWLW